MEEIKLNVKALAAYMKVSIEKLAELAELDANHLKKVSSGYARMTAEDIMNLSKATGIDPKNIEY